MAKAQLHLYGSKDVPHMLNLSQSFSHILYHQFMMRFHLLVISFVVGSFGLAAAQVTHDDQFTPDAILRVTEEEKKQSCVPLKNILVVNGTSPGPRLSFEEGKTVWIRVYNDVHDQNLTMVCPMHSLEYTPLHQLRGLL